ncbi:MAG: BMC domain-containing protein [Phycisphaerae bacterium]
MNAPALAAIEFASISAGVRSGDAMIKRAAIASFRGGTVQPGRYLVVIAGGVGEVQESYREGLRVGGAAVADHVVLPDAHASVQSAVAGQRTAPKGETLAVLETGSLPAAIHAADAAVKAAAVTIREVRLGDGLGGKGLVHLDGELADVQAAVAAATGVVGPHGCTWQPQIIPAAHAGLLRELSQTTRFAR